MISNSLIASLSGLSIFTKFVLGFMVFFLLFLFFGNYLSCIMSQAIVVLKYAVGMFSSFLPYGMFALRLFGAIMVILFLIKLILKTFFHKDDGK